MKLPGAVVQAAIATPELEDVELDELLDVTDEVDELDMLDRELLVLDNDELTLELLERDELSELALLDDVDDELVTEDELAALLDDMLDAIELLLNPVIDELDEETCDPPPQPAIIAAVAAYIRMQQ